MNGILNIFKPKGMSSFDVVRVVKKVAKTGKVGHTGTLDPEATGVLPVCIGRATKIIDYIMDSEKVYEVTFKLGIRTTTYDLEGEVLEEKDTSHLSDDNILAVIKEFIGEYSQVPPMYSALKQNGVRLYELARKGIEVTYIRSLCYDIGEKLGVFATMTELNRSKTSVFEQSKSININDLTEENIEHYIVTMEDALSKYEAITVHGKYVKLLINGVRVADNRFTKDKIINDRLYRVYDENNNFIGLGERNNAGFKIEKLLIT